MSESCSINNVAFSVFIAKLIVDPDLAALPHLVDGTGLKEDQSSLLGSLA